eukprot:Unigene2261_Nuclearia_a/m.7018 Unigene2261_Nuclearia_a/g.7018  ORF Unigene2261_Nuclearia_a/g.7018 Unigene2261_Nuclearia_a/m.7018 type:complete len:522 (+) Unigene2261_Nuclearia_a:214-1779(+)
MAGEGRRQAGPSVETLCKAALCRSRHLVACDRHVLDVDALHQVERFFDRRVKQLGRDKRRVHGRLVEVGLLAAARLDQLADLVLQVLLRLVDQIELVGAAGLHVERVDRLGELLALLRVGCLAVLAAGQVKVHHLDTAQAREDVAELQARHGPPHELLELRALLALARGLAVLFSLLGTSALCLGLAEQDAARGSVLERGAVIVRGCRRRAGRHGRDVDEHLRRLLGFVLGHERDRPGRERLGHVKRLKVARAARRALLDVARPDDRERDAVFLRVVPLGCGDDRARNTTQGDLVADVARRVARGVVRAAGRTGRETVGLGPQRRARLDDSKAQDDLVQGDNAHEHHDREDDQRRGREELAGGIVGAERDKEDDRQEQHDEDDDGRERLHKVERGAKVRTRGRNVERLDDRPKHDDALVRQKEAKVAPKVVGRALVELVRLHLARGRPDDADDDVDRHKDRDRYAQAFAVGRHLHAVAAHVLPGPRGLGPEAADEQARADGGHPDLKVALGRLGDVVPDVD